MIDFEGSDRDDRRSRINTPHVLVVDDNLPLVKMLEDSLKAHDIRVSTASSGTEALQLVVRTPVDLIISDFNMPSLNGEDFVKELRHRGEQAPVIIISGFVSREARERASALQVVEFIDKPCSPKKIADSILRALRSESQ